MTGAVDVYSPAWFNCVAAEACYEHESSELALYLGKFPLV